MDLFRAAAMRLVGIETSCQQVGIWMVRIEVDEPGKTRADGV
jgi:hypothetical protein